MITPQQGYKIDPSNPNQVIKDTSVSSPAIPISTLTSTDTPLNVQTPTPTPPIDIKNIPITTPSGATVDATGKIITPPTPAPVVNDFTTKLENLTAGLLGKDVAKEQKVAGMTADFQKSLNELNTQIKMHQANALARQEEALKSGETLRYSTGLAGQVARTDAIEAMKLSALAQGMQGNILLATKQAENAINAEFAQTEKDIATARQNILNNYDTFTDEEKKRADATLLALNEKDAFVARSKADREQAYKTAVEAAKNGLTDTSLLTQIQNSTPEKALELAAPFMKEKEKLTFQTFERNGRTIRQVLDSQGNVIKETDLGTKEGGKETTLTATAPEGYKDAFNFLNARLSKDESARATAYFNSLLESGDTTTAQDYLKTTAIANLPATEQTKAFGRFAAIDSLNSIKKDLDNFVAKGGNTGLLTGTEEAIAQKLGQTTNPEVARIGNEILLAMIAYRNAVSGAAFTESEQKQYVQVFPAIGKIPELNNAKIKSLVDTFNRNNKSIFSNVLGEGNYEKIFKETSADISKLDFSFGKQQTELPSLSSFSPMNNTSLSNSLSGLNFKF